MSSSVDAPRYGGQDAYRCHGGGPSPSLRAPAATSGRWLRIATVRCGPNAVRESVCTITPVCAFFAQQREYEASMLRRYNWLGFFVAVAWSRR